MKTGISLKHFKVDCLIGCLQNERKQGQTVQVDLCLQTHDFSILQADQLKETWDYTALAQEVAFILTAGRFHLLEVAARFIVRYLLSHNTPHKPQILGAELHLTKFNTLPQEALAVVSYSAHVREVVYKRESKPWGSVDVIDENDRLGLYRLNLNPGAELKEHYHQKTRESEYILTEGLECLRGSPGFRPAPRGQIFCWERGELHAYRNPSTEPASILCMDEPPFLMDDEIFKEDR